MEKIISVTDLVRNAARIAAEVEGGAIYRITRGGRGSMVLVDEEYFEGWMHALDEMKRPGWEAMLTAARRDVAARKGRDLDSVAKELGLEGTSHRARRALASRAPRAGGAQGRQGRCACSRPHREAVARTPMTRRFAAFVTAS
jgi:PHD/YefM family antitoxin component YafN of YafNO toxin-antitoxin module